MPSLDSASPPVSLPRRRRRLAIALVVLGALIAFGAIAVTKIATAGPPPVDAVQASEASFPLPFASTSFWNTPLPASTALDSNSSTLVAAFVNGYHKAYGTVTINTTQYTSPVYTVPASEPTVAVKAKNCQGGTYVSPALTLQLSAVPIPSRAISAAGTDSDMIVYQPSNNREWEIWKATESNGQWSACAGGEISGVSSATGIFPYPFGVAASGLSLLGGQIHLSDISAGAINHALSVAFPATEAGVFVAPADRTDGYVTGSEAIPEGTRFRLNPSLDLASLGLSPAALEIATAIQKYGIIINDTSGAVSFNGQDPAPQVNAGQANPYDAWFQGQPSYEVLSAVPWNQLQAVAPTAP